MAISCNNKTTQQHTRKKLGQAHGHKQTMYYQAQCPTKALSPLLHRRVGSAPRRSSSSASAQGTDGVKVVSGDVASMPPFST
jgi:hypothetical protein